MEKSVAVFPIYIFLLLVTAEDARSQHCCYEKMVGNVTYTLVSKDSESDTLVNMARVSGCEDNCVYQDSQGARYCFRKGGQPVKCVKEHGINNVDNESMIKMTMQVASVE